MLVEISKYDNRNDNRYKYYLDIIVIIMMIDIMKKEGEEKEMINHNIEVNGVLKLLHYHLNIVGKI